jgi:hypothetical protein
MQSIGYKGIFEAAAAKKTLLKKTQQKGLQPENTFDSILSLPSTPDTQDQGSNVLGEGTHYILNFYNSCSLQSIEGLDSRYSKAPAKRSALKQIQHKESHSEKSPADQTGKASFLCYFIKRII